MIVHETIGQHRRIPFLRIVLEERKVPPSILPVEEHLLPVIPPLDDMMGESWRNGSGNPRHGRRLALHRVIVKKMGCVPILPYFTKLGWDARAMETHEFWAGSCWYVPPDCYHQIVNTGADTIKMVVSYFRNDGRPISHKLVSQELTIVEQPA